MNINEILNKSFGIFEDGLLVFILHLLCVVIFLFIFKKVLSKYLLRVNKNPNKTARTSMVFYLNTLKILVYVLAIFSLFSAIKPFRNLGTTILGASSVLAVIVGLAAQETLGNFISGSILSIFQPFKVGDMIVLKEKNIQGRVIYIGFRHTTLRTFENTSVLIPNSIMNREILENRDSISNTYVNFLNFDISTKSDIEKAKDLIKEVCMDHEAIIKDSIKIYYNNLKGYAVELRLAFSTESYGNGYQVSSDIRFRVKEAFDKNSIEISYQPIIFK